MLKKAAILSIGLFLFISCTTQKTVVHISGAELTDNKSTVTLNNIPKESTSVFYIQYQPAGWEGNSLEPEKPAYAETFIKKNSGKKMSGSDCDTIILKTGQAIECKIMEVVSYSVRYKKCDSLNGHEYVIAKEDILNIHYANGNVEKFDQPPLNNRGSIERVNYPNAKIDSLALISMFLLVFGLFPIAIILSIISLYRIKKHPEKHKGRGLASAVLVMSIAGLAIAALLFILLVTG